MALNTTATVQTIQQATAIAIESQRATTQAIQQETAIAIESQRATTQAIQQETATTQAIERATATAKTAQDVFNSLKQQNKQIVKEDFSNNRLEWVEDEDPGKASKYIDRKEGVYIISFYQKNIQWWETWHQEQFNFVVEINVRLRAFKSEGGVIFGYQDRNNYYTATISTDGSYHLQKQHGGEWKTLVDWTPHPIIGKGLVVNKITVVRQSNNISIYINDILVGETQDDTLLRGQVGMVADSLDVDDVVVQFDNFQLWKLP